MEPIQTQTPANADEALSIVAATDAAKSVAEAEPLIKQNVTHFFSLLQQTVLVPGFTYRDAKFRETFELLTLAALDINYTTYMDELDRCSNIGNILHLLRTDEEAKVDKDLLEAAKDSSNYINAFMQDMEVIYASPGILYRRMKNLFKWKGTPSTVKRVCIQLESWGWFEVNSETGEYAPNPHYIPFALEMPLDFPDDGEFDLEDDECGCDDPNHSH
ncbi:hypothetical protein BN7874_285 [Phage NCTB]|jgi:hypothetical protein|nr:hypothetical protein BN7874_285 [Phage NCTB]